MPELPEVHTIVEDLKNKIIGYEIKKVHISDRYKTIPEDKNEIISILEGSRITEVKRLAKNIIIKLNSDYFLRFHLAMTGRILIKKDEPKDKWVHMILHLSNKEDEKKLFFSDMRMFGKIELLPEEDLSDIKQKYGPDPYTEEITPDKFLKLIKSRNTNIKNLLLNQEVIAGLGNIYVTEALYLSGIQPKTKSKQFNIEMAGKLLQSIKKVISEGIRHRGSTLPDKMYVDTAGRSGEYQKHFKIYMREKCLKCGSEVQNIKIGGRSSYFCPTCQVFYEETPQDTLF